MKLYYIPICFIFCNCISILSQKQIEYYLCDSSYIYADSFKTNEAPVCLNFAEVLAKLEWPYQVDAEGYVYATCLIDSSGNIEKVTELKGVKVFFDEVNRVIYMLKFSPGKINKKPVKYYGVVPFRFIIK
jgi:hypothetical protein